MEHLTHASSSNKSRSIMELSLRCWSKIWGFITTLKKAESSTAWDLYWFSMMKATNAINNCFSTAWVTINSSDSDYKVNFPTAPNVKILLSTIYKPMLPLTTNSSAAWSKASISSTSVSWKICILMTNVCKEWRKPIAGNCDEPYVPTSIDYTTSTKTKIPSCLSSSSLISSPSSIASSMIWLSCIGAKCWQKISRSKTVSDTVMPNQRSLCTF